MMDRRKALRIMSLISGGTIIAAEWVLTGCADADDEGREKAVKKQPEGPQFNKKDLAMLDEIGETIIPTTDTPGAKAVGIGAFMAMMVRDCYKQEDQESFVNGLQKIRDDFEAKHDKIFMVGSKEEKLAFLNELDKELQAESDMPDPQPKEGEKAEKPEHYFKMMKDLTILGYFSSKIGATEALRYVETPGRYDGCVPYEEGDRAWAV